MEKDLQKNSGKLYADIKKLIEGSRSAVAQTVNAGLTAMYWNIGKIINDEILQNKRADYGKQIVATLSQQLMGEYGNSFTEKNLRRIMQFTYVFPDFQIVATLWRQLSWSHFKMLIPLKTDLQREFYAQMCRIEKWSVRQLRKKIDSMLFERTAISKKPQELAKLELKELRDNDNLSPDLVFRNPYVLDFLNLKDTYQEKDLEKAILNEIEKFILELGKGFTFVERQKRMIIDGEEQPIGLILCAQGNSEQVELLQLDKTNIRVAEYITEYLPKKLLQEKLHLFYARSKRLIENRE